MEENKINLNEDFGITAAIFGITALAGAAYVGGKYLGSSNYKQKMIPNDKGYFNPEMMVGEKFTITYFTGNEEPNELMDLYGLEQKTGWKSYKDEYGTYLKVVGSSDNESTDMRVYLPKKEWFAEFKGKIRMISDSEGDGSLKHNNYGLCFYLKNPKNAIKTKIVRSDGTTFFGPPQNIYDPVNKTYSDDPSRGWAILDTFKQSGYFSLSPDVISQDVVESYDKKFLNHNQNIEEQVGMGIPMGGYDKSGGKEIEDKIKRESVMMKTDISEEIITPLQWELQKQDMETQRIKNALEDRKNKINKQIEDISMNPPSGLQEYQWSAYSEKYGRTDFDRWYDSSNGMWIVIGTQICMAIATGGISSWATAAVESTGLAIARNLAIQIGGELIAGGWEAVYLYNRGLNSQAALVAFCCFLPVLTESAFFGRIIGKPPGFDDSIAKLTREFKVGGMRSPADFQKWFKGLDPKIREVIKQRMEVIGPYYLERGTSAVSQKIKTAMNNAIAEIKRGSDLKIGSGLDSIKNWDFINNPSLINNPKIQYYIKGLKDLKQVAKEAKEIGTFIQKKGSFWKGLGLSVLTVGSLFPICMFAFKDNAEFVKDPQGILTGAENEIMSFNLLSKKNVIIFENKISMLGKEIEKLQGQNNYDLAFAKSKELVQILVDLDMINKTGDWEKKRNYHKFIEEFKSSALLYLQEELYNGIRENNKQKFEDSKAKFLALTSEVDLNKVFDSFFVCPTTYKKVQEGYSDEKGNLFKVDNNTLLLFIEWFIGYNPLNNIWTGSNSSYMSSKGITITTTFYFMSKSTGKMTESTITYDYSSFYRLVDGNFNQLRPKYDYSNQSVPNYWGNLYFIRKIFTDYYDDYLVSPKIITTTTTNKQ